MTPIPESIQNLPGHIFREYDIRGLHEAELSDPIAESIGRAFAVVIRREAGTGVGPPRVAIGRVGGNSV